MKKIGFSLVMFLLVISVNAQEEWFTLNWSNIKNRNSVPLNNIPHVKTGSFGYFKLKDINTFLYKVTIKGKKINLQTPMRSELQVLFGLSSNQINSISNDTTQYAYYNGSKTALAEMTKLATDNKTPSALTVPLNNLIQNCSNYLSKANELAKAIGQLKQAKGALIFLSQSDLTANQMESKVTGLSIPSVISINKTSGEFIDAYKSVPEFYLKALNAAIKENKTTDSSKIAKATSDIYTNYIELLNQNVGSLASEVNFMAEELKNEINFIVVSPPVQMEGDLVSFEVNIDPVNKNAVSPNISPMNFNFDVPAKGGLKVDFTVGPTFSFSDEAKDNKYYLNPNAAGDSVDIKKRENNNKISPSVAAMMHVYTRGFPLGLLFGVGAGFNSTTDVNSNFFLGGSIILGKSEKVMLNAGLSYLRVDRLKNDQYKEDSRYKTGLDIGNITEKVFRSSFFVGISYNITNRVIRN